MWGRLCWWFEGEEGISIVSPEFHALKADYLIFWDQKGRQELKNVDAAFLGWCKKRNERNPLR